MEMVEIMIRIPKDTFDAISILQAFVDDKHLIDGYQIKGNSTIGTMIKAIANGTPLPKCNQCKYYEGVHNVQGHAPCKYHKIGGVLWNWYCSQFEADKDVLEAKHG